LFNHFNRNIKKLELIPSSGGAFEVTVDGKKIYSKLETGVFPYTAEIIGIISAE
jgi:selenoprotein W-related protein